MNTKALVAEFVGTFTLIFIGAGAGAISDSLVAVAFAHGLVVLTLAYAYGQISGTHVNRAVTIGLWMGKQIETMTAVYYIIVQLLGGIVGALVLNFALGSNAGSLGATELQGIGAAQGLVIEIILTFLLVNTIFNTAVSGKAGNMAPVAIGLTLVFCIMMGGNATGASLNPARTLGPAIVTGNYADIWLYFVGPIVGGILAALLYNNVLKD